MKARAKQHAIGALKTRARRAAPTKRADSGPVDAVVVGSGPNGLSAAVTLARAGASVLVLEGHAEIGGGLRTSELTRPGYHHDVCAAVHPMGVLSPYFRSLPLAEHGLRWIFPPASVAHPLDDGSAVLLTPSLEAAVAELARTANRTVACSLHFLT